MVVPTYRAPGYGAQMAATLDEGSAGRLASILKNRENDIDLIGKLATNAEKVANVSGSGALDRLSERGGIGGDLFGGAYADVMDKLRQQSMVADINATNRAGTGSGKRQTPADAMKNDTMVIRNRNTGETSVLKVSGMDNMFLQGLINNGNPQYEVVSMGAPVGGTGMVSDSNGQTETIDGITYDIVTGEIVE